jgi:ABC-2 type transport system ATP-binding protein
MSDMESSRRNYASPSEGPALAISQLHKSFGSTRAVDGLNLEVKRGEFFGLLGPNGAGKTTTIKMMLGMLDPDEGSLSVLGRDPLVDDVEVKERLGYVAEEPQIYKSLTVKELFEFIASIRQMDARQAGERLDSLLELLSAGQYRESLIGSLSRGNLQKVQIAAALFHEPELVILDEPFSGLDARTIRSLREWLGSHVERGGTVFFSTHIMQVAEDLCDRITIIHRGQDVASGNLDTLRETAGLPSARLEDVFLKLTGEEAAE